MIHWKEEPTHHSWLWPGSDPIRYPDQKENKNIRDEAQFQYTFKNILKNQESEFLSTWNVFWKMMKAFQRQATTWTWVPLSLPFWLDAYLDGGLPILNPVLSNST